VAFHADADTENKISFAHCYEVGNKLRTFPIHRVPNKNDPNSVSLLARRSLSE